MLTSTAITAIILIVISAILFLIYIFKFYKKLEQFDFSTTSISIFRLLGLLLLGFIPLTITYFLNFQIVLEIFSYPDIKLTFYTLIIMCPLIIFANYKISQKENHYKNYPLIKSSNWSSNQHLINALSWVSYLFGYELMFRGILLYSCRLAWGTTMAVIINTIFYALAHLHKGKFETLGSIPLGILFCIITLWTQSFITVFILHCTMAISNDIFCIRMKMKNSYLNQLNSKS